MLVLVLISGVLVKLFHKLNQDVIKYKQNLTSITKNLSQRRSRLFPCAYRGVDNVLALIVVHTYICLCLSYKSTVIRVNS